MTLLIKKQTLLFLVFFSIASTIKAQDTKKLCEYKMIVNTGATRGPTSKLKVVLEAIGGESFNTNNVVKNWGDMGFKYTYFLPNSSDRFKTILPCVKANFCYISIRGKKGELKPHWYINNITVSTKGDGGINRLRTFSFGSFDSGIDFLYPYANDGECP